MFRKAAIGTVGVGAAGYGAYYMSQAGEVGKFEKEQRDIETLIETERKRAGASYTGVIEAEKAVKTLTQRGDKQRQAVEGAQATLDAARRQVSEAEAALSAKSADLSKSEGELTSTTTRISTLRSEHDRAKEAITLGERSLVIAQKQAQDSRLRLNPLNHPKVKAMFGGSPPPPPPPASKK